MANVIIGIHGLGNKPPKDLLEYWWKLAMIEGLKTRKFKSVLPKFELVYWADILHDQPLSEVNTQPDSPLFLSEKYVKASKNFVEENHYIRKKVVDFLSRQLNRIFLNEDFSLNYSFITDALVNKYFHDLEIYYTDNSTIKTDFICKSSDLIKARLLKTLEKYKNDDIMLISHSMGTIIAFDVLSFLAPTIPIKSFITMGSPLGLPVIISKIAAEQKQMLNGSNHMITPPTISQSWFNFADILDKVAFEYRLADFFAENSRGVKPIDFLVVNNYEINGTRNPHKSYGYLRTSEFSTILNEFIQSETLSLDEKLIRNAGQFIHSVKANITIQTGKIKNTIIGLTKD